MPEIVLSPEQAQLLAEASRVRVVDPHGNLLGHIDRSGWTPEEIAAIKRRAREGRVWYSGEQVQRHLQALDRALEMEGSIDEARARAILHEARAHEAS